MKEENMKKERIEESIEVKNGTEPVIGENTG